MPTPLRTAIRLDLTRLASLTFGSHRTSVTSGHGSLGFIQPQTRLRVVDNSAWSSIAPTVTTGGPPGSVGSGSKRQQRIREKSGGKSVGGAGQKKDSTSINVRSLLVAGTQEVAPKPALCIGVYNQRNKGLIGDKVLVAVGGQKKKGWIVGCRMPSKNGWPRFQSNNIVLVDDEGNPLGTRILVPIPARLRSLSGDINKILSIATRFV